MRNKLDAILLIVIHIAVIYMISRKILEKKEETMQRKYEVERLIKQTKRNYTTEEFFKQHPKFKSK